MNLLGLFVKLFRTNTYDFSNIRSLFNKTLEIYKRKGVKSLFDIIKNKLEFARKYKILIKNFTYNDLLEKNESTYSELNKMSDISRIIEEGCSFSIIVSIQIFNRQAISSTLDSIKNQVFKGFEIIAVIECLDDTKYNECRDFFVSQNLLCCSSFAKAIEASSGDYIMFLSEGDRILPNALFEFALSSKISDSHIDAIYCDHDYVNEKLERGKPIYKPGWSKYLFYSNNYIENACIINRLSLQRLSLPKYYNDVYCLVYEILLLLSKNEKISNIQNILISISSYAPHKGEQSLLKVRNNLIEKVEEDATHCINEYGISSIKKENKEGSKVTVVILDNGVRKQLEACLNSIKINICEQPYELVILSTKTELIGEKEGNKYFKVESLNNWNEILRVSKKVANGEVLIFIKATNKIATHKFTDFLIGECMDKEVFLMQPLIVYKNGNVKSVGMIKVAENEYVSIFNSIPHNTKVCFDLLHVTRECDYISDDFVALEKKKIDSIVSDDKYFENIKSIGDVCEYAIQHGYKNLYDPNVKVICCENKHQKMVQSAYPFGSHKFFNQNCMILNGVPDINYNPTMLRYIDSPSLGIGQIAKILIIKLDHIGDMVLSLPAIRNIRKTFPQAHITVLCASWSRKLVEVQPEIDDVIVCDIFSNISQQGLREDTTKKVGELKELLKSYNFDICINLRRHKGTEDLNIGVAKYTLAYSENAEYSNFSHPIPALTDVAFRKPKWQISDQLLFLTNTFLYDEELYNEIDVPEWVLQSMIEKINSMSIPWEKYSFIVGIHSGVGADLRQWPIDYFAKLADILIERENAFIILLGSKLDCNNSNYIISKMKNKNRVISIAGMLDILEYTCFLKKINCFIGNNSGPMHIAGLQGIPTVGIFSGTSSEQEWAPLGKKTLIITKKMNCSPCGLVDVRQCPDFKCLTQIHPEFVYEAVLKLKAIYL
jgi:ADP-heptose:LPS heptosyltransferase